MIITATCPLRISLVGGSTDHPQFLQKYKSGMVISFPCDLKTYITLHKDVFGINSIGKKYILNYSKREEVNFVSDIKNELIRNCFEYLDVSQINLFLTSDVPSIGSGLASSSSYLMALISAIYALRETNITESGICKLAMNIEKKFNPLVGQQDFYGSMGGLKKIKFYDSDEPEIKYLDTQIFNYMDMYLIHTGISRNSTDVLKTINIDNSLPLIDDVINLEKSIKNLDLELFNNTIRNTWINKKNTSSMICSNTDLMSLDDCINRDKNILSHKLLGAGNGGYFLIFTDKNKEEKIINTYKNVKKINISEVGIQFNKI